MSGAEVESEVAFPCIYAESFHIEIVLVRKRAKPHSGCTRVRCGWPADGGWASKAVRGGEGSAELRKQWDGAARTHSVEDGGVMRCSVGAASAALAKAGEGVLEARAKGNIF